MRSAESLLSAGDPRRLDVLLEAVPPAGRALHEIVFVLLVLFSGQLVGAWVADSSLDLALTLALMGWGIVLTRPHKLWREAKRGAAILLPVLVAAAVGVASHIELGEGPLKPRLGVELEAASAGTSNETSVANAGIRVTGVQAGSAADGRLLEGDVISAINGKDLSTGSPALDFMQRVREMPAASARFQVHRDGERRTVEIRLPPAEQLDGRRFFLLLTLRNICLLALAAALAIADGQRLRALGLRREGLLGEFRFGLVALIGAYVVHILIALPLGLIAALSELGRADAAQRAEFIGQMTALAEGLSFAEIPLYLAFAGAFEEVVFRGLLIPRLRRLVPTWTLALVLSSIAFGLGHLVEGWLGVLQTTALGLYFGAILLRRGRLESAIVAHAGFNSIMFAALLLLSASGLLNHLEQFAK